jgi:hypothetical protein
MKTYKKYLLVIGVIVISVVLLLFLIFSWLYMITGGFGGQGGLAVIVQESVKRRNEFIFHSFNGRSIAFYYAEILGRKTNHVIPVEIKGKIIIQDCNDASVVYEKKFTIPLTKRNICIYNKHKYNSLSHKHKFLGFRSNQRKWYIDASDTSEDLVYIPEKKCKLIIEFEHTPPPNAFLYAWIFGDVSREVEAQFEVIKEKAESS